MIARPDRLPTFRLPLLAAGLAEDTVVNQKVALLSLRKLGYRADLAATGVEALAALGRRRYDVVLMDVQMPGMDGLEATRRLRLRLKSGGDRVRVIAMTANAMEEDRKACLDAGMDDFVAKPIRMTELQEALHRAGDALGRTASNGPAAAVQEGGDQPTPPVVAAEQIATATTLPVIEEELLDRLRMLSEDEPGGFETLIREHLVNAGTLVDSMRTAIASGDLATLERSAHGLKSSSAMFGATRLSRVSAEVETSAREKVFASDAFARLEEERERAREALERKLQPAA